MKRIIISTIAVLLVALPILSGCNNSAKTSSTATTTVTESTDKTASSLESSDTPKASGDFDISSLQSYDKNSNDPFAGYWKISSGEGSSYKTFRYMFDGDKKAVLFVGNTGYCSQYSDSSDDSSFTCQLYFGINGKYTYKFSGKDKVVLTNLESKKTSTLERVDKVDFVPTPDDNPKLDNDIIGGWASDSGIHYYFDKSGTMYCNQYGTMFTYYKYSVKDGKITATYSMNKETTEEYDYSINGELLTIDGTKYQRIADNEMDEFAK